MSHLTKGSGPAIYRTLGSLAFVAAVRSAWAITKDKQDPRRRLFLPVKNNIAADTTGMAYSIVDGVVAWEREPVDVSVDEAFARGGRDKTYRTAGCQGLAERSSRRWAITSQGSAEARS